MHLLAVTATDNILTPDKPEGNQLPLGDTYFCLAIQEADKHMIYIQLKFFSVITLSFLDENVNIMGNIIIGLNKIQMLSLSL